MQNVKCPSSPGRPSLGWNAGEGNDVEWRKRGGQLTKCLNFSSKDSTKKFRNTASGDAEISLHGSDRFGGLFLTGKRPALKKGRV